MNINLKRGELAKKCGIHIATLRYYEKCRLLNPPPRSQAGYRLYSEMDIAKIHFIKNAQKLGFSLKEISELMKLRILEGKTCDPVLRKAQNKLGEVEQKIKNLKSPLLVMHGKNDKIVPFYMGENIFNMANNPKFKYFTDIDDHMMDFDEKLINEIDLFINSLN